jgi:hypothetical protein
MSDKDDEIQNEQVALMKELVGEVRKMRLRIDALEEENMGLRKAVDDPETIMRKHGWKKFTTPHADETFDPLNRNVSDQSFSTPFEGSGDLFLKSRDDQLREWEDAERQVKNR